MIQIWGIWWYVSKRQGHIDPATPQTPLKCSNPYAVLPPWSEGGEGPSPVPCPLTFSSPLPNVYINRNTPSLYHIWLKINKYLEVFGHFESNMIQIWGISIAIYILSQIWILTIETKWVKYATFCGESPGAPYPQKIIARDFGLHKRVMYQVSEF